MLRFARNDGDFRNDGILDGILNEIAPSVLLPRNDAWNSRIPYRDPPKGLGDDTRTPRNDESLLAQNLLISQKIQPKNPKG